MKPLCNQIAIHDGMHLEFSILEMKDCNDLVCIFDAISKDPTIRFFHPHEFTEDKAHEIACLYSGQDLYFGFRVDFELAGYALLRGWDEGFQIPTLGIYLLEKWRGLGLGKVYLSALHDFAFQKGAKKVMLKVDSENFKAKDLYEKAGYTFGDLVEGNFVGYIDLTGTMGGHDTISESRGSDYDSYL